MLIDSVKINICLPFSSDDFSWLLHDSVQDVLVPTWLLLKKSAEHSLYFERKKITR